MKRTDVIVSHRNVSLWLHKCPGDLSEYAGKNFVNDKINNFD